MAVAASISLAACASTGGVNGSGAGPVSFDVLAQGSVPAVDGAGSEVVVLRSGDEVRALRVRLLASDLALAERVDFGTKAVLAVFGGRQMNSGVGVQVDSVGVERGKLIVEASLHDTGGIAAQVLSAPYALLTVDRGAVEDVQATDFTVREP